MQIKRLRWSRFELAALLIILCVAALHLLLTIYGWPASNSDEGTMGLEAMHIAYRGELPIYLYGQNYMGVAEAYLGAALFRLFGVSLFSLRFGMILLYTLFLVNFYLLTRLLYTKGLALFSLVVVSIGANSTLLPEMMAGGGLLETLICGTTLLLLATLLALSTHPTASEPRPQKGSLASPSRILKDGEPQTPAWLQQKRWRLFIYGLWACIAGLGLWSHLIVVPFLLVSGLLLILFCWHELRATSAKLSLLAGFVVGGFPLIVYNVLNPLQNSLVVFLQNNHAVDALAPTGILLYLKEAISTFLFGVPIMTGFSPTCQVQQLPLYGPSSSTTLFCSLAQGAWSLGYLALLVAASLSAWRPLRKLWRLHGLPAHSWPAQEQRHAIIQSARLALVLSVVLTLLPYAISPVTAEKPWGTRYLIGLLIATPAILWPLWQGLRLRSYHTLSQLRSVLALLWRLGVLLLLAVLLCLGTAQVFASIPAAQAQQQNTTALVHYLTQADIKHIYSDYWTCDNIIFASHEHIICAVDAVEKQRLATGLNRYMPYYNIVRSDPRAVYVLPLGQGFQAAFAQTFGQTSNQFQQSTYDGYLIYRP